MQLWVMNPPSGYGSSDHWGVKQAVYEKTENDVCIQCKASMRNTLQGTPNCWFFFLCSSFSTVWSEARSKDTGYRDTFKVSAIANTLLRTG